MASFSHGTENKRDFQKRLLPPPPTAHPPLSGNGDGSAGRRGILGRVGGVRNAEFGGVPSPTPICILTPAPGFLQLPNLAASVAARFCTSAPHSFWPGAPFPDGEDFSLLLISVLFLVFFTSSLGSERDGGTGVWEDRNPLNICVLFVVSYMSDYPLPLWKIICVICMEVMGLMLSKLLLAKVATLASRGFWYPQCVSPNWSPSVLFPVVGSSSSFLQGEQLPFWNNPYPPTKSK